MTYYDMLKCCWPAYFTVMYDANEIGTVVVADLKENNNYAMWLTISQHADCCLLDGCLSRQLRWQTLTPSSMKGIFKWRYEVYRSVEHRNPISAAIMTYRNLVYTLINRKKYVR